MKADFLGGILDRKVIDLEYLPLYFYAPVPIKIDLATPVDLGEPWSEPDIVVYKLINGRYFIIDVSFAARQEKYNLSQPD
jgi:hypothetical protein